MDEVRTRLLDAAQRCFYAQGITATGVDVLAREAGVSKRTLYSHFGSKDGLVAAYLQRRNERWERRLAGHLDAAGDDPLVRILAIVDAYAERLEGEEVRGCAFINAAAEIAASDHPGLSTIRRSVDVVEQEVRRTLEVAGAEDPAGVAGQVLTILEGAIALSGIRRSEMPFAVARDAVRALVGPVIPRGTAGFGPAADGGGASQERGDT